MISPVKVWRNQKTISSLVGKTGRIVTFTVIRVPMSGFSDQAPYATAIVETDAKTRFAVQVVDSAVSGVKTGQTVKFVLRKIREPDPDGVIPYGIKAVVMDKEIDETNNSR